MSSLRSDAAEEEARDGGRQNAIRIDTDVFAAISGADESPETEPTISRWLDCWQG